MDGASYGIRAIVLKDLFKHITICTFIVSSENVSYSNYLENVYTLFSTIYRHVASKGGRGLRCATHFSSAIP